MAGKGRFFLFVAVACVTAYTLNCTTTPLNVRYENYVQQGITAMGEGDYDSALEWFNQAIKLKEDSPDAHALKGIAILIKMMIDLNKMIEDLVDFISSAGGIVSLSPQQGGFLMELISGILYPNIFGPLEQAAEEFDLAEKGGYFHRYIPSIPIEIRDPILGLLRLKVDLGGEWDLGDIYFVDSFITMLTSFYYLFISTDLTMNIFGITPLLNYPSLGKLSDEPLFAISNILATVLNVEPRLLKVNSEGPQYVQQAKELLLEAIDDEQEFIRRVTQESFSEGQFITSHPEKEDYALLTFTRYDAMGRPITQQVEFEINDRVPSALEHIKADLSGEPGARTSWAEDLAPLIGIALVGILRSGLVTDVLSAACYSAVEPDQRDICDQILSPTFLTEDFVVALLTAIIPPIFEFDLDALFNYLSTPGSEGIRGFLPAWTKYYASGSDYYSSFPETSTDTIIMEWDCGVRLHYYQPGITQTSPFKDRLDENFYFIACKAEALQDPQGNEIPDIGHFKDGSGYPVGSTMSWVTVTHELSYASNITTPPDDLVSPFPYFLFKDPTLGGTLWVDFSGVWPSKSTNPCTGESINYGEYDQPNNCELNATLAAVAGAVLKALSSFMGGSSLW